MGPLLAGALLLACSEQTPSGIEPAPVGIGARATTTHESARPLSKGDEVPPLAALAQTGARVSLRDFTGRVLLLFHCQSLTSERCVVLAKTLRSRFGELRELDAAALGVTQDPRPFLSELAFELELPFYVLADPSAEMSRALDSQFANEVLVINREAELHRRVEAEDPAQAVERGIELATVLARDAG